MITKATLWFWFITHAGTALLLLIVGHVFDAHLVAMIGDKDIPLLTSFYFRSPWWLVICPLFFLALALYQTIRTPKNLDFTPFAVSLGSASLILIVFGFILAAMVAFLSLVVVLPSGS